MTQDDPIAMSRRALLQSALGFGALAVNGIMAAETQNLPDGKPHFMPEAKRVIWLFMRGGVSHMESFDPKPALNEFAGKSISETSYKSVLDASKIRKLRIPIKGDANGHTRTKIFPMQTGFKRYGQSGIEISDWFPNIGSCADDIAFIRSMWTGDNNHGAQVQFHFGRHFWIRVCQQLEHGSTTALVRSVKTCRSSSTSARAFLTRRRCPLPRPGL